MEMLRAVLMVACFVNQGMAMPQSESQWTASPNEGSRSWKSNAEELPSTVVEDNKDYKIVRYEESKWVCTRRVVDVSEDPMKNWKDEFGDNPMDAVQARKENGSSGSDMFKKLFRYIIGVNSQAVEIKMTKPVTTLRSPVVNSTNQEEHKMCFWTGSPWQDKALPLPIDKDVFVEIRPATDVFVRRFGGWALSREDWMEHQRELVNSLEGRTDVDLHDGFYSVGYDSPWQMVDRRNEIWIPRIRGGATVQRVDGEEIETIPYDVISKTENFELRKYPASRWVCTKMDQVDPSKDPLNGWQEEFDNNPFAAMGSGEWNTQPSSKMFMKLFKYISGVNSGYQEIEMTTPVTMKHVPSGKDGGEESQEMCFWLSSKVADPPVPVSKDVYIQKEEPKNVYVRTFGGFALSYEDFHEHYLKLKSHLEAQGMESRDDEYIQTSYNSPFSTEDRRNEIWIEKA